MFKEKLKSVVPKNVAHTQIKPMAGKAYMGKLPKYDIKTHGLHHKY